MPSPRQGPNTTIKLENSPKCSAKNSGQNQECWIVHTFLICTPLPYGTLRTDSIEDTTLRTATLRTGDVEDRQRWGQATLRTGNIEDKIILKISTISKFAKLLKFSKIVKNIGYMMPTLGGWMFLLDICCQHLEKICNFEGFKIWKSC